MQIYHLPDTYPGSMFRCSVTEVREVIEVKRKKCMLNVNQPKLRLLLSEVVTEKLLVVTLWFMCLSLSCSPREN
jgi:hypothetical protein